MHGEEQYGGVSIIGALERLREAGQRILSDEIGLTKLETQERLQRNVRAGTFLAAGAVFALLAWCAFMLATFFALLIVVPATIAALVVAGVNLAVGGGLTGFGLARMHRSEPQMKVAAGNGRHPITRQDPSEYLQQEGVHP